MGRFRLDLQGLGFYSMRIVFLITSIFLLILWIFHGFDSVVDQLFESREGYEGVGYHFSTLHAQIFLAYITVINIQVGGFKSLKHLFKEIKIDLKSVFTFHPLKARVFHEKKDKKAWWFFAFMYSFMLQYFALFFFEAPYVHLFNWMHFEDLLYPIYMFNKTNLLGLEVSATLLRNYFSLFMALSYILLAPRAFGYKWKYRFNKKGLVLLIFFFGTLAAWVYWPSSAALRSSEDYGFEENYRGFPKQELFKQTIYIYVNSSSWHTEIDLDGFYVKDDSIHFINVYSKYICFLAIGYIFMVYKDESSRSR